VADNALALPPLTMLGTESVESTTMSRDDTSSSSYSFDIGSTSYQTDPYIAMLPYLGLKERRPYPHHVSFDVCDSLGAKFVDKVSEAKRKSKLLLALKLILIIYVIVVI